jgi:uncharacterized protein (TIGR02246 family)
MTDDERQIRELVDAWMAAGKAGDVPAVLALMTEDVIFMTPGKPPFGRKEFAADSEKLKDFAMAGRSDIQEVEIFGDHAYIRNRIQITLARAGEEPRRMSGYTLSICGRKPIAIGALRATPIWSSPRGEQVAERLRTRRHLFCDPLRLVGGVCILRRARLSVPA